MENIDRGEFVRTLSLLKPGVSGDNSVESNNLFCFLGDRIVAYNDEIQISAKFETEVTGGIPAKELFNIVNKMTDNVISITTIENKMVVTGKRKTLTLSMTELNESFFVDIQNLKWKKIPAELLEAVKFCLFSVSDNESQALLNCIHIEKGFVESSDNYRLTRRTVSSLDPSITMLLPKSFAKELVRHDITKCCIDNWTHFKTNHGIVLSCRKVDGTFPPTSNLLQIEGNEINFPKSLKDTILRSKGILSGEEKPRVTISISDKKLTVSGVGDNGKYVETLKTKHNKSKIRFGVSPEFLLQILPIKKAILSNRTLSFEGKNYIHVLSIYG